MSHEFGGDCGNVMGMASTSYILSALSSSTLHTSQISGCEFYCNIYIMNAALVKTTSPNSASCFVASVSSPSRTFSPPSPSPYTHSPLHRDMRRHCPTMPSSTHHHPPVRRFLAFHEHRVAPLAHCRARRGEHHWPLQSHFAVRHARCGGAERANETEMQKGERGRNERAVTGCEVLVIINFSQLAATRTDNSN